jgi:tetratricopeptide (TPR) repeat protein
MHKLTHLIKELHRRSLWQVLGIFLAASWGVLQVVEVMTETVGLPDWTPSMAFVALLLGLPMVLATAFVQEGLPGAEPPRPSPAAQAVDPAAAGMDRPAPEPGSRMGQGLFTWKNALLGGLGAFTLLGISIVGYFIMWTTGIGPVGNLEAQGVFEEGEPVILADFDNLSNDASLDEVVTETLRVDLASSQAITLVPRARVADVLGLMQRDPAEPLTNDVAREVAIRSGVKAVVEGEVGAAGSGFILVARLIEAQTGSPIATFRRTADGPDDVIEAIDGLSQDIREKAGESLRTIKAEAALEDVTTSSIEALRDFTRAERLTDEGDFLQARALLIGAVELDPAFAMAWRKLSVVLQSAPGGPWTRVEAATRAWELRDRLTDLERANALAWYHRQVTGDQLAEIEAYELLLADYPDDPPALNNLAIAYSERGRHEDGIVLLERAVSGVGESGPAYVNLVSQYAYLDRVEDGWRVYERMLERYPARDTWPIWDRWYLQAVGGAWSASLESAEELLVSDGGPIWRSAGVWMMAISLASTGRVGEALDRLGDDLARATRDGRETEIQWQQRYRAGIRWLTLGADAARPELAEFIRSGGFEAISVGERDWSQTVEMLAALALLEEANQVLALWERDVGDVAGSRLREARRKVEAAALQDPASRAQALLELRDEMNCPVCFEWWLAELHEEAGDLDKAVEHYQAAISVAHGERNLFPLMRVIGHERLGRIHQARGDRPRSAAHFASFAAAWAEADPELQPRVRAAAAAGGA